MRLTVENAAGNDSTSHTVTIKQPPPDQLYSDNLYSSLVRYQNPDMSSCVATATLIMLNEVATRGHRGSGFTWTASTALGRQRSIMSGRAPTTRSSPDPAGPIRTAGGTRSTSTAGPTTRTPTR